MNQVEQKIQKYRNDLEVVEFETKRYEIAIESLTPNTKLHSYVLDKLNECDRVCALTKGAIANLERIGKAEVA